MTDFTNDPGRISAVVNLLLRNQPAFRETNLFDALKFVLVGGRGDSVVLEDSKTSKSDYSGLVSVQGRRRAVILIASGIDTFSRSTMAMRARFSRTQVFLFTSSEQPTCSRKSMATHWEPTDGLLGQPGRMTFLQAENALNTFAKETGGAYSL